MDFKSIEKIINDIVGFIKSFAANLKKFINGFKNDVDFVVPSEGAADDAVAG